MKQKRPSLADRLVVKLRKLGLSERKATALAKGLTPTAARAGVTGTVTGKLTARLVKLGLSERKATELAKGLAPIVRAAIKAKAKAKALTLDDVTDEMVNETVTKVTDDAEDTDLDKVAPRVNGHRVRLDLPVVERSIWQRKPVRGIELLRVMDGLTSEATYLVAAVKSDEGIVAVRQLGTDLYNVKFYPHMAYWGYTPEQLDKLKATEYLAREWYQRMHFDREGVVKLLKQLDLEAKPAITRLLSRLMNVSGRALFKAFEYLHKRVGVAA